MLELVDVHAGYGPVNVLHGVSLRVDPAEIVTLIGANGAGKSTTLMTLCGFVRPQRGTIRFLGEDITTRRPHDIVRLGLVQSPEGRRIFARMTVQENLQLGGFVRLDRAALRKDIDKIFALFPILGHRRRQLAGTLSGGEQQMLALGRAMMAQPKLLVLDEPSLGLAPQIVKHIFTVMRQLHESGVTVLLVEQNANMALTLAHRGYVMETGRITMADTAQALAADPRVRAAYLGEEGVGVGVGAT